MADVKIYVTDYCPYCVRAKGLLTRKKIPFTEINVEGDAAKRPGLAGERDEAAHGAADLHRRPSHRGLRRPSRPRPLGPARQAPRPRLIALVAALAAMLFAAPLFAQPRRPAVGYGVTAWRDGGYGAVRGATLGPIESSQHPGVGYGTPATPRPSTSSPRSAATG